MHQECANPSDLTLLSARIHTLHGDVSEIKDTLKDLTTAINKLAIVEERLANTNAAQERAFKSIAIMEKRLDALEKLAVSNTQTAVWVDRGIMAIVGAALMFVWDKITKG